MFRAKFLGSPEVEHIVTLLLSSVLLIPAYDRSKTNTIDSDCGYNCRNYNRVGPLHKCSPYMGHAGSAKGWTYGTIASIQGGGDTTHPTWILSGHWGTDLINKTKEDFNQTNPAKFDASFTMVLLNGSAKHSHHISNFSLTDVKDENDTLSYTGLATVTLRAGPMKDVPIEIKVFNNNVICLWLTLRK